MAVVCFSRNWPDNSILCTMNQDSYLQIPLSLHSTLLIQNKRKVTMLRTRIIWVISPRFVWFMKILRFSGHRTEIPWKEDRRKSFFNFFPGARWTVQNVVDSDVDATFSVRGCHEGRTRNHAGSQIKQSRGDRVRSSHHDRRNGCQPDQECVPDVSPGSLEHRPTN